MQFNSPFSQSGGLQIAGLADDPEIIHHNNESQGEDSEGRDSCLWISDTLLGVFAGQSRNLNDLRRGQIAGDLFLVRVYAIRGTLMYHWPV